MVNNRDSRGTSLLSADGLPVEWVIDDALVDYNAALLAMDRHAAAITAGTARERVWLVEHPPLFTAGTSAKAVDLLDTRFPVFDAGRGGQYTYHGPGQRIAYVMLDLNRRKRDVRAFVAGLEDWIILTLDAFSIRGERRTDRVGVWVKRPDKGAGHEDKIAAIGVRVRRWVTLHGISLNVEPDLSHFSGIVPCGIADPRFGVTSLMDLGLPVTMPEVDSAMRQAFETVFGPTAPAVPLTRTGLTAGNKDPDPTATRPAHPGD